MTNRNVKLNCSYNRSYSCNYNYINIHVLASEDIKA